MLALEPVAAYRVVSTPGALDVVQRAARQGARPIVLRVAADELLVIDATPERIDAAKASVVAADPFAIVEPDDGLVGAWLAWPRMDAIVTPHLEWALPDSRPIDALGLIASIPCQLWLTETRAFLMTNAACAHDLVERLS